MTNVNVVDRVNSVSMESKETEGFETIIFNENHSDSYDDEPIWFTKGFVGRLLFHNYFFGGHGMYSAALTKKGRIVVWYDDDIEHLGKEEIWSRRTYIYKDFEDLNYKADDHEIHRDLISRVAYELGIKYVQELDI